MKNISVGRKYLATTSLTEIWDKSDDIVLLAPWCSKEGRNPNPNKRIISSRDICYTTDNLLENAKYCEGVYHLLLEDLRKALNRVHGVGKNTEYWSIVLNSWLIYYINAAHERYLRVQNVLKDHADTLYTHVVDIDDGFAPSSTIDFMANKIPNDYFNLQLISQIVLFMGIDNKRIDFKKEHKQRLNRSNQVVIDRFKTLLKRSFLYIQRPFLNYGPVAMVDMYHLNFQDYLSLEAKLKSLTNMDAFFPFWRQQKYPYDRKLRSELVFEDKKDEPFVLLMKKTLPYAIPRYCLEGYPSIRRYVDAIKRPLPKVIISAIGWYLNDHFKIYAAEMKERGAKLGGVQHGGDYGFCFYQSPFIFELKEKDLFFSWGWSDTKYPEKIRPLPSPHLSKIRDKGLNQNGNENDFTLFISANLARYPSRIGSNPGPEGITSYFRQQVLFLENISPDLLNKFYYRPLKEDFGRNIKEFIKGVIPSVKWAEEGRGIDWIKKSKVVIVDYPVTCFIEALAMNVPLILYIDFTLWRIKDDAKEYFNILKASGILYEDAKSAALKLNEIYDKASQWWQRDDIQKVRCMFLDRYGYTNAEWRNIWVNELQQLTEKEMASE